MHDNPGQELARQLDEILLDIRKPFAMFGGTSWSVVDVSVDALTIAIYAWPKAHSLEGVSARLGNAILAVLQDMVPCATLRTVFFRPTTKYGLLGPTKRVATRERDLYSGMLVTSNGPIILIEENVEKLRREWRPRIEQTWNRLLREA